MSTGELDGAATTPEYAIIALAMVAAGAAAAFVWSSLVERDPMAARLGALAERREELRGAWRRRRPRRERIQAQVGLMRRLLDRINLLRGEEASSTARELARAGYRSHDALVIFLTLRVSAPLVLGLAGMLLILWTGLVQLPEAARIPATAGLVLLGALLPRIALARLVASRQEAIRAALPDAVDLMVICAEAGLSLDAAMTRVAREIGPAGPELADELGLAAIEIGFLPERRKALDNLLLRCDLPAMRALVNTLLQAEKYGTPLARSLRVMAAELRDQRLLRAEEKAARLPAIMTVPMILFILPTMFIVVIGPAILQVIDSLRNL
ncbi:MAG: type II secretion system F family protein [Alphaproteobacteria bacterium]|nr:type II secretion system F family protein [Alphaproteobacteria bacterium]